MRLIDADLLDIIEITTDDYSGNEVLDVVLKEDIDNEPTVKAIPVEVVEQIREKIEQLHDANIEDTDFCDGLIHALVIIDEHIKEVE